MILIGQYDSPFVRRVGITLHLYELTYEHRPWSVFRDADRMRALNPLGRVPTLLTDDGAMLLDSAQILDHLDDLVGPARALLPALGPARTAVRRRVACATGICEKAVALIYERMAHDPPSAAVTDRATRQITDTLAALEQEQAGCATAFFHGDNPGHDDIALACATRFLGQAHPGLLGSVTCPAIAAHATRCESLPAFQAVRQAFVSP